MLGDLEGLADADADSSGSASDCAETKNNKAEGSSGCGLSDVTLQADLADLSGGESDSDLSWGENPDERRPRTQHAACSSRNRLKTTPQVLVLIVVYFEVLLRCMLGAR
eukprot:2135626-Alexandrium_andersonii.AAC.1